MDNQNPCISEEEQVIPRPKGTNNEEQNTTQKTKDCALIKKTGENSYGPEG